MSWQAEMADRLNAAKSGESGSILREYAVMTGKSQQSLYRIAAKYGYNSGRKRRADAGESTLTDQQIDYLFALIDQSSRDKKGAIMPVGKALKDACDNGVIEPGTISVSRAQALLRERKLTARDLKRPEPHIQMRSLHPNHVHQVDASVCIQYYLKPGGKLEILPQSNFYKNKFENYVKVKRKIIRWVLTDHFSGTIFVKYYEADGERTEDLFDCLMTAWGGGYHAKFPFRGVPEILMMDAGSANKSRLMVEWLKLLDVDVPKGTPGRPTRDGSVEKAQDLVERWFESTLRFEPATSIEQLNEWAADWCAWYNAERIHSRHGLSRTACWMHIQPAQLRELPDKNLLTELFCTAGEERTVSSSYAISWKNADYSLRHVPNLAPQDKVTLVIRPFKLPEISVTFEGVEYVAMPIAQTDGCYAADAAIIGQEHKALPESPTQKARKRSDNLAYGEERKKDARPFADSRVMGNQAAKVAATYLPRRGTEHPLSRTEAASRQVPVLDVIKRISAEIGRVSPQLNRSIKAIYGPSISTSEADRIVAEIVKTGGFTPPAPEQLTAGGAAC